MPLSYQFHMDFTIQLVCAACGINIYLTEGSSFLHVNIHCPLDKQPSDYSKLGAISFLKPMQL